MSCVRFQRYPAETMLISRVNKQTGTRVELWYSYEADPDQPWETVCRDHGTVCSHQTRRLAERFLSYPEEWCEVCMENAS